MDAAKRMKMDGWGGMGWTDGQKRRGEKGKNGGEEVLWWLCLFIFKKKEKNKTKQNKTKNQETLNNLMQTSFRVYHKLGFKIDSLNKWGSII